MSLHADTLINRSYLKRQISKWRMVAVLALFVPAIFLSQMPFSGVPHHPYVARVSIEGIIVDDLLRDALFQDLAGDENVKAVVLRMDSPGGTVVGGEQLYWNVLRLAKVKPVVVTMRAMATSAGYMATLGATRIFASKGTMTGSIGVILQTAEITDLVQKLGIEPITIKSGVNKASPNPFEKMSDENRQVIQNVVMDSYDLFVNMVASTRHLSREKVLSLADGRVYTGQQALKNGLIDAIGGEDEALLWLEKERGFPKGLEVVDRKPEEKAAGTLKGLFGEWAGNLLFSPQNRIDGLASIWQVNPI